MYKANNSYSPELETNLLKPKSEPIMRSIIGINWAKKNNQNNNFLFISYNELVDKTEETINKIYDFCSWKKFRHNFKYINLKYPENDEVYSLKGQHRIRNKIKKIESNIVLPNSILEKCNQIDKLMNYD